MPGLKKGIEQIKMQKGGNLTDFGKAFAKARRDFINKKIDPKTGKPAKATFMFQGKRFNVQTADDRKKTVTKVESPVKRKRPTVSKVESPVKRISLPKIKAAAKVGSKRGLTAAQSRGLGLTGTQLRDRKQGLDKASANLLEKFTKTKVIFGFIDIAKSRMESVEEVRVRIKDSLEHIDEHRLIAAPDCGLGFFTREQAIEKMTILTKAAKSI